MNDIDEKLSQLQYNPEEVLLFDGESIQNFKPAEETRNNGRYIVVTREKIKLSSVELNISTVAASSDITFPGALLLANRDLVENHPTLISVKRKPISCFIDLPGFGDEARFTVSEPVYSAVSTGISKKFSEWSDKYARDNSITARSSYKESMITSEMQMLVKFGLGIKVAQTELNIDFSAITEGKTSVFLASFQQIFYSVSVDYPDRPSDLFDTSTSWQDLSRNGVSDTSPPVLVHKVDYGRSIFVKLETSSNSKDVEAAFKAVMEQGNTSADTKYKEILDNTTFTVVVLGGGIEPQSRIINCDDISKVREIITEYSSCDRKNPGYPISYATSFVKDNKVAAINSATDYIKTTYTEYHSAEINIQHRGAYDIKLYINWDQISYDDQGIRKVTHSHWHDNDKTKNVGFQTVITLDGNAENVCVRGIGNTGVVWDQWHTIVDKKGIALVPSRKFEIKGITVNMSCKITPGI